MGMSSILVNRTYHSNTRTASQATAVDVITPVTILRQLPFRVIDQKRIAFTPSKGKEIIRESDGRVIGESEVGEEFDVIGYNKPRGILGPIARRGVKLGKRKRKGSGTARNPGCLGTREPGKVSWRKPFMGRHGGNRRTIRGNVLLRLENLEGKTLLYVRGSIPGKNGNIVCLR